MSQDVTSRVWEFVKKATAAGAAQNKTANHILKHRSSCKLERKYLKKDLPEAIFDIIPNLKKVIEAVVRFFYTLKQLLKLSLA